MKTWLRAILAIISAAWGWFIYINLAKYLLDAESLLAGLQIAEVSLGDFPSLVGYLESIGWLIVGANFAHRFAPNGSAPKAIWRLVKALLKILFWSIFIYVGFNTIDIGGEYGNVTLFLEVDITLLFYALMGGIIFELILSVLDFLIAFIPEKPEKMNVSATATPSPPAPEMEGM